MSHFARIRRHPLFAPLFAAVHPFFWPILYWQLGRFIRWMKDENLSGALFGVTWWGQLHVMFPGDRNPDPDAYKPYAQSRPRWDDPVWASDVPAVFLALDDLEVALLLPHEGGGLRGSKIASRFSEQGIAHSAMTEGALLSTPNTS